LAKGKRGKAQKIIYKTLHRKLKIDQHESYLKPEVNSSSVILWCYLECYGNNYLSLISGVDALFYFLMIWNDIYLPGSSCTSKNRAVSPHNWIL